MKDNLKTRPKFYPPKSIAGYTAEEERIIDSFEKWFIDFEQELRQLRERRMAQRANKQWQDGYCACIDEVLGDAS